MLHLAYQYTKADNRYDVTVREPTFIRIFPKVLYDEAHFNTHKAKETYRPFIDLITNDGYLVSVNKEIFSTNRLENFDLLIICNAKSDKNQPRDIGAFTEEESKIINKWVKDGGSLLLIADHHPFGLANKSLALTFGVEMGSGTVRDNSDSNKSEKGQLEFSRANGLLEEHPINQGYKANERIDKVITFNGQSLKGNQQTKSILKFGKSAMEIRPDSIWSVAGKNHISYAKPISVEGLSQAISIEYGKGKVVILGEAAMLTSQKLFGRRFGMDFPKSIGNRQFALNIMHWLTSNDYQTKIF
ncbi:MAG: hypothetical protein IPL46_13670 [Saprospiraceae bacterium]|nr:hypothetical protein [Saprospiraceae bacterium]